MMLPSLAPAAAFVATTVRRRLGRVALFAGGYLMVWSAAGVAAYGLFGLGRTLLGGSLAWQSGGRTMTAGVLALAALYQLAPPKRAFLSRCRKPPQGLNGPRRRALTAGLHSGGWCLGSSWVLMAALFALGVMSLVWMALIALLVAAEKIGPAGRGARLTTAAVMSVLAISILAVPRAVPGFVIPGSQATGHAMRAMGWRGPPTGRRSPTSSLVALVTGSPESLRTGRAPVRLSA
jgi:predicted metal-binding membrane protein